MLLFFSYLATATTSKQIFDNFPFPQEGTAMDVLFHRYIYAPDS